MKTAAKKPGYQDVDPDEYFAETRMSFGDHIEELRKHLWRAIVGFTLCFIICFFPFIGKPILDFIVAPVEAQLIVFHEREVQRELEKLQKDPVFLAKIAPKKVTVTFPAETLARLKLEDQQDVKVSLIIDPQEFVQPKELMLAVNQPKLTALRIEEVFMVYVKVCMVTGFVVASPWIFFQIWSFIAAGLYPHEKKLVNYYLPFSIGLFIGGVAFCQFIVIPRAIEALLWFNEWLNIKPDLRLSEWLNFAILLPVIFGLSFQTPLVMLFFYKVGIVTIEGYGKIRKYAYFALAIASAVLTPTGDPQTMLLMWVPMCLFYEMGIWMCKLMPGRPLLDFDVPESEEVVEV